VRSKPGQRPTVASGRPGTPDRSEGRPRGDADSQHDAEWRGRPGRTRADPPFCMSDWAAVSPGGGLQIRVICDCHSLHAVGSLVAGGQRGRRSRGRGTQTQSRPWRRSSGRRAGHEAAV